MTTTSEKAGDRRASPTAPTSPLVWGAIAGPVLLTVAWVVLGLLVPPRVTEYGVQGGVQGTITSPISGIGVGPHAGWFNAAFIISGLLTIVGVLAAFRSLRGTAAPRRLRRQALALCLSPLGFVVAGLFTLADSVPLHMMGFLLVAGTPLISFVTAGRLFRTMPGWQRFGAWLIAAAPLTLLLTLWFLLSFQRETIAAGQGVAGIPSRLLALELGAYYTALGAIVLQRPAAKRGHSEWRRSAKRRLD